MVTKKPSESFLGVKPLTCYSHNVLEVMDVGYLTARKVGRRATQTHVYPIVYIPKEINAFLNLKPGDKIVIYMPDEADHFEVWPLQNFLKRRREGRI